MSIQLPRDHLPSHAEPAGGPAYDRLVQENLVLRAALAELQARLEEKDAAAERDPLTGLPNRTRFLAELDRVVAQAARHGTPSALVWIALDNAEAVAARHGQFGLDAAVRHLGRLLSELIRTSDVAARVDGTCFALILDHLDGDSAIDTSERIGRCIASEAVSLGATSFAIEPVIGVATILAGDSAADVLARAQRNAERGREF